MTWLVKSRGRRFPGPFLRRRNKGAVFPYGITAGMATLTVQHVSGGLVPAYSAASAGGDKFTSTSGAILNVTNGSGVTVTVTIVGQVACNLGFTHNGTLVLTAGQVGEIGTFDYHFVDTAGFVNITYSAVTSVTVAVTAP